MIIPLREKYRTMFHFPKHAYKERTGKPNPNKRPRNGPDKFFCPGGGEIKMVTVFCKGLKNVARCQRCKREERKPSDF